jgi:GGDEF domain-containing protein
MQDGLQNNEFNLWASHKSVNDEVYFGGVNGVTAFEPENIIRSNIRPRVKIIEVLLNGKPLSQPDFKLSIENENDLLAFKVSSLNFYSPRSVRYRYRIEGASNEWYDIGDTRIINIFGLNKGVYKLNIQASHKPGEWVSLSKPVQIVVHRVFWKSTTAVLIYLLLFFASVTSGFYFWYRKLNEKQSYIKGELEKNRQYIRQLQLELEKATENNEYKQQEIERLSERVDYFRSKFDEFSKQDKTTGLYQRNFFLALINQEDAFLRQENAPFPKGCVVTLGINNYRNLLASEYHANIEVALAELADTLREFSAGDDLLSRWDDSVFMMLESGTLEQLEIKLYNLYRILKSRSYNCGNGRLIRFEITMAIIPTPFPQHHSNLLNRSLAFQLADDLIRYLLKQKTPSVYIFECVEDCHPVEIEKYIADGVEQLISNGQFKLISLAKKLVKESV